MGASTQSDNWVPWQWTKQDMWWQGALKGFATGALIGTGLAVAIDAAPLAAGAAQGASTSLYGMSAGLTQVVEGAAQGVLSSATSTILTDAASGKWNNFSDDLLTADITGAITGALKPEMNKGMAALFGKDFIKNKIGGKIIASGINSVVNGIIKDEVKDVYKYGWSGFWNASIYNNGSNINSDIVTNFAGGVLKFSNFMDFSQSSNLLDEHPSSKYLRGLSLNAMSLFSSTILGTVTTIKAVNRKFEFEWYPNDKGIWFNSLIKSVPPIFIPQGFK